MVKTAKNHLSKKMELVAIAEQLFVQKGYEETSIILKTGDEVIVDGGHGLVQRKPN